MLNSQMNDHKTLGMILGVTVLGLIGFVTLGPIGVVALGALGGLIGLPPPHRGLRHECYPYRPR